MRTITILLVLVFISLQAPAQTYKTGHTNITFYDASRMRHIPSKIYYPSLKSGKNALIAQGCFPVIVFGHGFSMTNKAYKNIWEALVPHGYIMVFPYTEGSLIPGPDHAAFGEDIRFLNGRMKQEGKNIHSPFYGKISSSSALMGHSMGGGASFLAAANNRDITVLIALAPAHTSPSTLNVCKTIQIPVLIFYAENDGVTPYSIHQKPMYDSLISDCKTIIGIKGGSHCYFADYNVNCSTGEAFTNPKPIITRKAQHAAFFDFLLPYLNATLKNNNDALQIFKDSLKYSKRIVFLNDCKINNN